MGGGGNGWIYVFRIGLARRYDRLLYDFLFKLFDVVIVVVVRAKVKRRSTGHRSFPRSTNYWQHRTVLYAMSLSGESNPYQIVQYPNLSKLDRCYYYSIRLAIESYR